MGYCPECRISVEGGASRCPLCGTALQPSEEKTRGNRMYPAFGEAGKPHSPFPLLAKIFAFISLITVFTCTLIDLLISRHLTWSLYVSCGILGLWMTVGLHLLTKFNLNYKLLIDLCTVSLYMILIDRLTGWTGWSVDYVIPILYICIMIATVVLALVFRLYWREYILSLVAACVLGLGPLLIFFNRQSPIRYLCLSAALLAGALLVGILFFAGGKLFSEWKRRMNL